MFDHQMIIIMISVQICSFASCVCLTFPLNSRISKIYDDFLQCRRILISISTLFVFIKKNLISLNGDNEKIIVIIIKIDDFRSIDRWIRIRIFPLSTSAFFSSFAAVVA